MSCDSIKFIMYGDPTCETGAQRRQIAVSIFWYGDLNLFKVGKDFMKMSTPKALYQQRISSAVSS